MASIGEILGAKRDDKEPKKEQKQQKHPKKQKVMNLHLDTSLDTSRNRNSRGRSYNNRGGYQTKHGNGNNSSQQLEKLLPHADYVRNSEAPGDAVATYNFVPFTRTVLASPLNDRKDDFQGYLCSQKTYSGRLDLELKNLTPLFIGDGQNKDAEDFFAPDGSPLIPGSSLRGMVRSLFKIVTAGAMRREEDFTDRHLYFRCLMAPKKMPQLNELHAYYANRMATEGTDPKTGEKKTVKQTKPGFLYRLVQGSTYHIAPCRMESIKMTDYPHYIDSSTVDWGKKEKKAYILTGKGTQKNQKKYIRCLSEPDFDASETVPDDVIQEYRDDTRRRGVDLLNDKDTKNKQVALRGAEAQQFADRKDIDFLVPCFYTKEKDGLITSFGHGRSYRIPYRHSVGDRLPQVLQEKSETIDFTDAVFGRKEDWAGRLSFEDARLTGPADMGQKEWVKPLLGANPTSFQLYLTQKDWPPAHWDSDAPVELRGYKMYWHKNIDNNGWKANKDQQNGNITKKIQPLLAGNTFKSAIHFRNLTKVELGALLKVFHLQDGTDQDIVYKLGMGKSLGMGSIRIKTALHLDSDGRYTQLFDNGKWQDASKESEAQPFLEAFDDYAAAHLGTAKASYDASLEALRIMLDWKNTQLPNWNHRVRAAGSEGKQLSGGVDKQFTDRAVLPKPKKVVKN